MIILSLKVPPEIRQQPGKHKNSVMEVQLEKISTTHEAVGVNRVITLIPIKSMIELDVNIGRGIDRRILTNYQKLSK